MQPSLCSRYEVGMILICSQAECQDEGTNFPLFHKFFNEKTNVYEKSVEPRMESLAKKIIEKKEAGYYLLSFDGANCLVERRQTKEVHFCRGACSQTTFSNSSIAAKMAREIAERRRKERNYSVKETSLAQGAALICSICQIRDFFFPCICEIFNEEEPARKSPKDLKRERAFKKLLDKREDGFYLLFFDGKKPIVKREDKSSLGHACPSQKESARLKTEKGLSVRQEQKKTPLKQKKESFSAQMLCRKTF